MYLSLLYVCVDGQGDGGEVKLSRHSTGRLIAIKNISKWRESVQVLYPPVENGNGMDISNTTLLAGCIIILNYVFTGLRKSTPQDAD